MPRVRHSRRSGTAGPAKQPHACSRRSQERFFRVASTKELAMNTLVDAYLRTAVALFALPPTIAKAATAPHMGEPARWPGRERRLRYPRGERLFPPYARPQAQRASASRSMKTRASPARFPSRVPVRAVNRASGSEPILRSANHTCAMVAPSLESRRLLLSCPEPRSHRPSSGVSHFCGIMPKAQNCHRGPHSQACPREKGLKGRASPQALFRLTVQGVALIQYAII